VGLIFPHPIKIDKDNSVYSLIVQRFPNESYGLDTASATEGLILLPNVIKQLTLENPLTRLF